MVIFRAGNLPHPVDIEQAATVYYIGSLYATLGAAALFSGLLFAMTQARARKSASEGTKTLAATLS